MPTVISIDDLKGLFTKPYGADAPTKQKWAEFYNENVIFTDPTQETKGLDSYVKAQEKLVKRCDDVFLETHAISITCLLYTSPSPRDGLLSRMPSSA